MKVIADVEERAHARKRFFVFDLVDVTLTETERKAHIPCGNIFVHSEPGKSVAEFFSVRMVFHKVICPCFYFDRE